MVSNGLANRIKISDMVSVTLSVGAALLGALSMGKMYFSAKKKRVELEQQKQESEYRQILERKAQEEYKHHLYQAGVGNSASMIFLGKRSERTNIRESLYWYEEAAKQGNNAGMAGIMRLSELRKDNALLKERAEYWRLHLKASSGDLSAKFELGESLMGKGSKEHTEKGVEMIKDAADGGHVPAILYLGNWAQDQKNPEADDQEAAKRFFQAAKCESLEGKIKLGTCYLKGKGVPQSHIRASFWLESAAEKGSAKAMCHAGEAWLDKGSEQGRMIGYLWLYIASHFGYRRAKALRDKVASEIDVNSVIGLQTLAKALIKELTDGNVTEHSIIKIFNKYFKRESYFPDRDGIELELAN